MATATATFTEAGKAMAVPSTLVAAFTWGWRASTTPTALASRAVIVTPLGFTCL